MYCTDCSNPVSQCSCSAFGGHSNYGGRELLASEAAPEPHPPSRHCMCADCRPSFDDDARPPAAPAAQPATPLREVLSNERSVTIKNAHTIADFVHRSDDGPIEALHAAIDMLAASSDEDRKLMEQALEVLEGIALDLVNTQLDHARQMYGPTFRPYRLAAAEAETTAVLNAIAALRSRLDGEKG